MQKQTLCLPGRTVRVTTTRKGFVVVGEVDDMRFARLCVVTSVLARREVRRFFILRLWGSATQCIIVCSCFRMFAKPFGRGVVRLALFFKANRYRHWVDRRVKTSGIFGCDHSVVVVRMGATFAAKTMMDKHSLGRTVIHCWKRTFSQLLAKAEAATGRVSVGVKGSDGAAVLLL